jgi:ribosomal protein L34
MGFMARAEGKGGRELLAEVVQAAMRRLDLKAQG